MPYLWSLVAVLIALVALGLLATTLLGPTRRLRAAGTDLGEGMSREVGMLTARAAALRVRMAQRRA